MYTIKISKTPLGFLMFDILLTDATVNQFLRCRVCVSAGEGSILAGKGQ